MGFEYGYTCPDIDKVVRDCMQEFETSESDYNIEEVEDILNYGFDEARYINAEMRAEADRQIRDLEKELKDTEEELSRALYEIEQLRGGCE